MSLHPSVFVAEYIMLHKLFNLNFIYLILIAAEIAAIIFLCVWLPAYIPVTAAVALFWVLSLAAGILAYFKGASPEISCSVILMIIAFPIAGALVYLFSSFAKKRRGLLKVAGAEAQSGEENTVRALCGTGGVGYDKAVYLKSGKEFYSLLFSEIERAKSTVNLEYFIVHRGKVFSELLSALRSAKRNGAEIKFIIDGIGSAFKLGRRELRLLRSAGAEVKVFHRIKPLFYTGLNNRDHRKIAVIDDKVAFTGGFNIGDEYANIDSPFGYWKDSGVAVYGEAACVFGAMFLSVWNRDNEREIVGEGNRRCIPFYDSPPALSGVAENIYMSAICSAQKRVHILTPYFCAGEKINSALTLAAMRGVDVRIIIPHIPDKKYAFELSRTCASKMSDSGIKFYEFTPGFMHAKCMVCDDKVYLGTYNFDFRSLRLNYECGVIFEGAVCDEAERDFSECMRLSMPFQPIKVKPFRSLYRFFLKLFAPLF